MRTTQEGSPAFGKDADRLHALAVGGAQPSLGCGSGHSGDDLPFRDSVEAVKTNSES